jgi:methionyl-tRNA formyltransferase
MVKETIAFPKHDVAKFCLVGSGKVLTSFAKMLLDNDFTPPILVTWDKRLHERDFKLLEGNNNYENIFNFAEKNNLDLIQADNINDPSIIEELKRKGVNVVFSISSRWIFREIIIDAFKGLVLNIHAGYLPRDRGSVVYSKILNKISELGVTIHCITPQVDAGPILMRVKKSIEVNNPTIDEITSVNIGLSNDLLEQFLDRIINHEVFIPETQDIDSGIYMPQPYTEINGFIDWKWKVQHIESFIRAFGHPMPGAATFYKNREIKILESFIENIDIEFHPLYFGRIVNITQEGFAKIATQGGLLVVTKIMVDGCEIIPGEQLKAPNVLYTPFDVLERARIEDKNSLQMLPPASH